MERLKRCAPWSLALLAGLGLFFVSAENPPADLAGEYTQVVRPLLQKFCLDCHSTKVKKGSLDLERFTSVEAIRKDLKTWQHLIEQVEAGEMPPKARTQPTEAERKTLLTWVRGFLDAEARARAGDPGHVPLRRLSNSEYTYTLRDLTGVDLQPAREFPADGAGGEGFTNAAEALGDISPTLLTKYLNAAKDIADHAVLLPDGVRFSPKKTRRDWTDEGTAALRKFYATFAPADGKLVFQPYLAATIRHRDALIDARYAEVAEKEKLNAKYLAALWTALNDKTPSEPLDSIRNKWRTATEKDVPALAAEVAAWQTALWKTVRVGSYIQEAWGTSAGTRGYADSLSRQVAVDPPATDSVPLRLAVKPAPGQSEVVLYLSVREAAPSGPGPVIWARPRFETPGKPALLLRDYAQFGPAFEIDYPSIFATSAKYLAAVIEATNDKQRPPEELAKKHELDAGFLKRWIAVLAVEPFVKEVNPEVVGRVVPVIPLTLLEEKTPPNAARPAVNGWHKKGTDLPVLITNSSDKVEQVPGRVPAHGVAVHPLPAEFVAVVWKSPITGSVRVSSKIVHAHPACGNGIAYWIEHRHGDRAAVYAEGSVDLGGEAVPAPKTLKVEKGDSLILAIDAKDGNHSCDLTDITLTITESDKPARTWDLAKDIANSILDGNPHADSHGNGDTWSFVRGPSRPLGKGTRDMIPGSSLLGKWRDAASDPDRQEEAGKLATKVQALLSGPRPAQEKSPDRILYDSLVAAESVLFQGIDPGKLARPRPAGQPYGLPKERFGQPDDAGFVSRDAVTEIHLPAALFLGREFAVEGKLEATGDRIVQFQVTTAPPTPDARLDSKSPVVASPTSAAYKQLVAGNAEFRRVFPLFTCFPQVVPTDEVVCLKMFHREDEPLERLFLSNEQVRELERLWTEHRFVSRQPVAENAYLPQFIGFTTQDTPKEMQQFFIDRIPVFKKRADEFLKDAEAAIPKHLDRLLDFAARAYRRPLTDKEKTELRTLYDALRQKGAEHDEAFRGVLARVLVAPAFLFRIEEAPAGKQPMPVDDWEQATRLSYFLWSSSPDPQLRSLAEASKMRETTVLVDQTRRMLQDPRIRALAIEFGTQWIHVRNFDEFNEKNERLFPTFDAKLRATMYEESIRFFQDFFQADRPVTWILDADATFVNDTLAKHYGISGVAGPDWRRIEGVRKYGRGGILGLASVQAKQAGASRTSPVLRGNWIVETLLGEKLPRPPANVPKLPEEEGADQLTTRQQVVKHTRVPECAVCHVRIDPFGFALERYDAIGRHRDKDLGGLVVDSKVTLKDGTEFDGIDGLRDYLLTKKKDVFVRLFCRRLLGYALGRTVTLSDTALLDEMVAELNKNEGRVSAALLTIVRSPQFRMVRGSEFEQ
jgi:hypothetical protein